MERQWSDLTTLELASALRRRARHKDAEAARAEHEETAELAASESKFLDAVADRLESLFAQAR